MKTRADIRHLADQIAVEIGRELRAGNDRVYMDGTLADGSGPHDRAGLERFARRLRGRTARAAGLAADDIQVRCALLKRPNVVFLRVWTWR